MPRRNPNQKPKRRAVVQDPHSGRSHSHKKPSPTDDVGYSGERLERLAGRLAVLLAERGVTPATILDRRVPARGTPAPSPQPTPEPKPAPSPPKPAPSSTQPTQPKPPLPSWLCRRHPNGGDPECPRCRGASVRLAKLAAASGQCVLHPDGDDSGLPCSGCAAVRRRRRLAEDGARRPADG